MIDIFNTPNSTNTQVFLTQGDSANVWQTWQKPKNCKFVNFFVLGGGAGGGGGRGSVSSTAGGGAGGGSSSLTTALFPTNLLPDTLFVSVGVGGVGGAGGTAGNNGSNGSNGSTSTVAISTEQSFSKSTLISSGGNAPTGGGGGQLSTSSTAGVGGTVFTTPTIFFTSLGYFDTVAGFNGSTNIRNSPGNNITISGVTSGGAAGGGSSGTTAYSGGSINSSGFIPTVLGGSAGSISNAGVGNAGFISVYPSSLTFSRYPFTTTGGAGGGSAVSTFSGNTGGVGGYGSGGGGGGGTFNGTGGNGGRGGDGLVIITCW